MRSYIAVDSETELMRPAKMAPELACMTYQVQGRPPCIVSGADAYGLLRSWLAQPQVTLIGHNMAYDAAVFCAAFPDLVPAWFAAYESDRVTCTLVRQRLLDVSTGSYRLKHVGGGVFVRREYTLEALARRLAGITLQKDAWRLSYGNFIGLPLPAWDARAAQVIQEARATLAEKRAQYDAARAAKVRADDAGMKALEKQISGLADMVASTPEQAKIYPLEDARATLAVWQAQETHADWLHDQYRQAKSDFALHLMSCWGARTSTEAVSILERTVVADLEEVQALLQEAGIVREDGSRDTKAAKRLMFSVCREGGLTLHRTDGHTNSTGKCRGVDGDLLPDGSDDCAEHIAMDGDACEASEHPLLEAYAELAALTKVRGNDVKALLTGITYPIHTRMGFADTGRTTSSKPNVQNWARARACRACSGTGQIEREAT